MKMNLSAMKLVNFRGYINATVPLDMEMNVIIGKNDIGKSTILEALAIFFGFGQYSMEAEDKNVYCDQTDV